MIIYDEPLYLQFDPLSVIPNIAVISGSVKQVHYSDSNTYTPNRMLTPLHLQPSVYTIDPNKKIANGDKIAQLSSGKWYHGNISTANQITKKTTDSDAATADYAIGTNYRLVVRKNTSHLSPEQLFFVATYFDSRRGMDVTAQASQLLSTTTNAESEAAPVVVLDKPEAFVFNPIDGLGNTSINASVFRTGKPVTANVKYWWYVIISGISHLIGSTPRDLFYVSGQNTSTLIVNTEFIGQLLIRCKSECYTGAAPASPSVNAVTAETTFIRRLPTSLHWRVDRPTGDKVLPGDTEIRRTAVSITNDGEIPNPGRFNYFRWLHNTNQPGAVDTEVGHGVNLSLPVSHAGPSTAKPSSIILDVYEYTEYQAIELKDGDVLTDNNGNIITGFTIKK